MYEPMNRLKEIRQQQGLSANALAKISGVSHPAILYLEQGKHRPHPRTIAALADALGVTVDDLIGDGKPEAQTQTTTVYLIN